MDYILSALAVPLGALLSLCDSLLHNHILAIIFFTLLTKVILFPVSLWTHTNSLTMVRIMPELNQLKVKYYGDKDTIAEETQKLYKKEGYHPLLSTVPMIIQLILLMGVIGAVRELLAGSESMLSVYPSQEGGITLLMPLAAGLAALALGQSQNRINPLQREQHKAEQWMTNGISILISLVLGAFVPVGVGFYWIASNLLSILNQFALNAVIKPAKHIDYEALEESRKQLAEIEALTPTVSKEDKLREKQDYKRFFSVANKHLVFYSEKSGFYKYFRNVIEYLLAHSNVVIHYVTNDPKDQIFELAKSQPKIRPYYIGQKKIITLFMKMDADIVVMTTPDLDNFYLKRSYVRKDIEYIYMFHGMASTNMVVRKGAYDHFDTVLCVGQHQIDELREAEGMYNLPAKNLVPVGYGMFDDLVASYVALDKSRKDERLQVMIAPSWQEGNILECCIEKMLVDLAARDYRVIVRPHPEFIKRFPAKMEGLKALCAKYSAETVELQTDFSSNATIYMSDVLITDWSGIAYEFAFTTKSPVLFVDTPMKVLNEDYIKYKNQPTDITFRNRVGKSLTPEEIDRFAIVMEELVSHRDDYAQEITDLVERYIFHIGESGKVGAKYILSALKNRASAL